jgi:hypothetical protein
VQAIDFIGFFVFDSPVTIKSTIKSMVDYRLFASGNRRSGNAR